VLHSGKIGSRDMVRVWGDMINDYLRTKMKRLSSYPYCSGVISYGSLGLGKVVFLAFL
jgi:hypothetical protein